MTLEDKILDMIVPTKEDVERIDGTADRLKSLVQRYMDEHGIVAELKLVGSYSKGTYLSNPDLDLFIMFPMGTSREYLEKTGLQIGEDVLHGTRMYAEHPYTSAVFEGVDVDLVPNIHIDSTDKLETAVDRTPFHTQYILGKLKNGQNNQIRLLKKFMKGIGTYGAEPNIRGFSGYLCELLVLRYGTFIDVLKAAAESWREGIQISLEKKSRKLNGAMVFYDPVDGKRNVASAVHVDTMSRFILASRDYLENPSEKFFFPSKRAPLDDDEVESKLESQDFRLLEISFDRPDTIDDNLYAQVWKSLYAIGSQIDRFGFGVLEMTQRVSEDRIFLQYILQCDTLPGSFKHAGPPVWGTNADNFLKKWENSGTLAPFVENGRWTVIAPRQYCDIMSMLDREVAISGLGKTIDAASMKVLLHDRVLEMDRILLTDLIDPVPSWKQ